MSNGGQTFIGNLLSRFFEFGAIAVQLYEFRQIDDAMWYVLYLSVWNTQHFEWVKITDHRIELVDGVAI